MEPLSDTVQSFKLFTAESSVIVKMILASERMYMKIISFNSCHVAGMRYYFV